MKSQTMKSHILLAFVLVVAMVCYSFIALVVDVRPVQQVEAAVPTTVPTGVSGPVSGDSVSMYNGGTFGAGIGIAPAESENALTIVPPDDTTYGLDVQNAAGTSVFKVRGTGGAVQGVGTFAATDNAQIPISYPVYQLTAAAACGTGSIVTATAVSGQELILFGSATNATTITETSGVVLLGAGTRALGDNDVLHLIFDGTVWNEMSFIAN